MVKVSGRDTELKELDIAGWHRYREYILGDLDEISERDYLRKASTAEGVSFLLKLMLKTDTCFEVEITEDNCVEIFYDIICYVENQPVEIDLMSDTGQEQYKNYMRRKNDGITDSGNSGAT